MPGDQLFPSRFELVRNEERSLLYRGKAAYTYVYPEGDPHYGFLSILVFFGRRYYYLDCNWLGLFPNATFAGAATMFLQYLELNLKQGFVYDSNTTFPLFVSEPLDYDTSRDIPTPTNVGWFYATQDDYGTNLAVGAPISTRLLCDRCNESEQQYCEAGGSCDSEREVCVCDDGFVGSRCESYIG